MIYIRIARPEDALGIATVHINAWKESYRGIIPDEYLDALSVEKRCDIWNQILSQRKGTYFTLVAVEKDEVVGFVDGGLPQQPEHGIQTELAAIYLLKKFQGTGIGKQLFSQFVSNIKASNFKDMYLWVLKENPAASFYRKMGGQYLKSTQIKIGDKELIEDMFIWNFVDKND